MNLPYLMPPRPDPPAEMTTAVWVALGGAPHKAVRDRLVTTALETLLEALTDDTTSDTEAYRIFVRTVALLNVFVVEEKRR
ncbi:MAG: hypothetical protein AUI14_06905 [Actinobacteria bacterium 13_2_20CM_2_71_6]|nr:MAG: hypothetical protein AUI14_06905 [Actinobacteria bacterium 13_2_20CM_2_71_6]